MDVGLLLDVGKSVVNKEHSFIAGNWMQSLYIMQDCKCFYCNKSITAKERTADHVWPASKGGKLPGNTVWACPSCNLRKGDTLPNRQIRKRFYKLYDSIGFPPIGIL
jgi:5-methylcytosine-specific restriction endonuclease McrA